MRDLSLSARSKLAKASGVVPTWNDTQLDSRVASRVALTDSGGKPSETASAVSSAACQGASSPHDVSATIHSVASGSKRGDGGMPACVWILLCVVLLAIAMAVYATMTSSSKKFRR